MRFRQLSKIAQQKSHTLDYYSVQLEMKSHRIKWGLALSCGAVVILVGAGIIPVLDGPHSRQHANEAVAVSKLLTVITLQNKYEAAHPDKGFACESLGSALCFCGVWPFLFRGVIHRDFHSSSTIPLTTAPVGSTIADAILAASS
jgi:hypothetical protein